MLDKLAAVSVTVDDVLASQGVVETIKKACTQTCAVLRCRHIHGRSARSRRVQWLTRRGRWSTPGRCV